MFIGDQTAEQAAGFAAARARVQRGGPEARVCGARTRTGAPCRDVPIREGKGRCLRHAGPDAARLHRENQRKRLAAGKISYAAWTRAEARRETNRLRRAWRKDPRVPGRTIDLGAAESAFQEAARALGADVDGLYPALSDWLRWRWQRTQRDRRNDSLWRQAVREELPRRCAAAAQTVALADLGVNDWRTRAGRAAKAALRAGGLAQARAVLARMDTASGGMTAVPAPQVVSPARGAVVWAERGGETGASRKRARPDRPRRKAPPAALPAPIGRPRKALASDAEALGLGENLRAAGPSVRAMFAAIPRQDDRLRFLRDLAAVSSDPANGAARARWGAWVAALGGR